MIADRLAPLLARRGIHYGWVVAGTTFLAMLTMAGAVGAPGVLIVPLQREFGWDAGQIGFALAIRLVLFGLVGPFAAALMNRFGLSRVALAAIALVAAGLLASLGMTQVWQLVLFWGVAVGFGTGLTAMVLAATVATRWFAARRGLVVGLLTASSATGQLAVLPLAAWLTDLWGWRAALAVVCVMLALAALAVAALLCDRPADLGLPAYGESRIEAAPPPVPVARATVAALADAARTRTFWVLAATFFVCGASTNGLVQTHFVALCADYGLPAVGAASVLAAMGAFDFVGTVASGWLSDRYDNRWLLFWYYGLRGLSLLYLPFTDFGFYGLSLFAVFYGLDWLATVPPTVKLVAARYGRERANLVFGWVFAAHQVGAAVVAFAAGLSRATLASYLPAFFAAGALCLIAAAAALTIGRRPAGPVAAPAAP